MYRDQVPIKTTKGIEEIKSRANNLSAEVRRILIMVNGHSSVEELSKKLIGFGEIEPVLVQLEIDGFIAPNPAVNSPPGISRRSAGVTPPPSEISRRLAEASQRLAEASRRSVEVSRRSAEVSRRSAEASHPPAPSPANDLHAAHHSPDAHHPEFNLEKAKGFIRFVLFAALGPTAERRINRIEDTTTPEELRVELDAIHDMLPKVLSKKEAQQAWRQLEPIMISITMPP